MYRLYKKNELTFSLLWIGMYVILFSIADNISAALGFKKLLTAPLCFAFVIFLWCWIRKQGLTEKYGLCHFKGHVQKYFYFIPLVLIGTCNLWNGITMNLSAAETVLYILSMLCVGFIEEVIFRGLLFKAICKDNVKQAILISSITFGIGHIVNLINGAEMLPTLLQICYATAIGFLFTIIFYKGKSLIPCILTHSILNALSVFAVEGSKIFNVITAVVLSVISVGYAMWILLENQLNDSVTDAPVR